MFALYDKVIQSPSEEAASNSKRKSSPRQKNVAKGSKVINLQGNLFVTMLANLEHAVSEIDSSIHTVILSLQHVSMIDVAGVQAIIKLYDQLQGKGQHLMIAGANSTVKQMLIQGNVEKKLGADSLFANLNTALTQAEQRRGRFSITVEANEPVWNGTTALALFRPSQPDTAKGRKKHK